MTYGPLKSVHRETADKDGIWSRLDRWRKIISRELKTVTTHGLVKNQSIHWSGHLTRWLSWCWIRSWKGKGHGSGEEKDEKRKIWRITRTFCTISSRWNSDCQRSTTCERVAWSDEGRTGRFWANCSSTGLWSVRWTRLPTVRSWCSSANRFGSARTCYKKKRQSHRFSGKLTREKPNYYVT